MPAQGTLTIAGLSRRQSARNLTLSEARRRRDRRGSGGYGKPRPAVIVQTKALPAVHASVIVCQKTSDVVDAPDFRVTIETTEQNALRTRSQIMADKPVTIRRERIGRRIGSLDEWDIARLNLALAFVVELADRSPRLR